MSTNSTIVLKLKPEDVGRIKKCDLNKLPVRTKKLFRHDILPNKDILNSVLRGIKLPKFLEIYHHWDGYPDSLGAYLVRNYDTYDKVLNLLLVGDVSTIIDGVVPYNGFNNDPFKGWERKLWDENKPTKADELPEQWQQYQYYAMPDPNNPDKINWFWREDRNWHNCKTGKFAKL
jgi:hypothetical protein